MPRWGLGGAGGPGAQAVRAICWHEGAYMASEGILVSPKGSGSLMPAVF